jgi:transcriptional regulator with XRE-family HTH domain
MADLKLVLAANVRRLRYDRGWTQEQLAERVALSARYVGAIERGQVSPSVTVLGRLAEVLSMEPSELIRRHKGKSASRQRAKSGPVSRTS